MEARWAGEMRRQNQFAWLAWHIAALSRAKRLPKLQTMLVKKPAAARTRQSWQEQLAVMDAWMSAQRNRAAPKTKDA